MQKMTWSEAFETVHEKLLEQEKACAQKKAQAKREQLDVPDTANSAARFTARVAKKELRAGPAWFSRKRSHEGTNELQPTFQVQLTQNVTSVTST